MAFTGRHYAPKIVHSLLLIVAQFSPLRAAAYVGVITHHDQRLKAGFGTKRNRVDFRSEPKQVVGWLLFGSWLAVLFG
jgi:hypothetical protein